MRILIFLGLLALACSSSSFLRILQVDSSPPPSNNGILNNTNSSNSTDNSTGLNSTDSETALNNTDGETNSTANNATALNGTNNTNALNNTDDENNSTANSSSPADNSTNSTTNTTNSPNLNLNQLFNASGQYALVSSNCTIIVYNLTNNASNDGEIASSTAPIEGYNTTNSSLCIPQLILLVDSANSLINVTFVYPLNASCGNSSNQTFTFTYPYANGIFIDTNATSSTYGFQGVYLLNNQSVITFANDTVNTSQTCFAYWLPLNASQSNAANASNNSNPSNISSIAAGSASNASNASNDSESAAGSASDSESMSNSTNSSNSTNASNSSAQNLWQGAWSVASYQNANTSMSNQSCCVPDSQILVYEDSASQNIFYMLRSPDCPECGAYASTVTMHNVSIVGGGGTETDFGVLSYIYMINNTVVYVTPSCYILFEPVAPTLCNNSTIQGTTLKV